jgi:hypothetical protein
MIDMESSSRNNDVEQPRLDAFDDVYFGNEDSFVGTYSGPAPEELHVETVQDSNSSKMMGANKLWFSLGAFVILLASIPITLVAYNSIQHSSATTSSTVSVKILNDVCLEAITLDTKGVSYAATTIGAKHDDDGDIVTCGLDVGEVGPTVWFTVVGTGGPLKLLKQEENDFTNQISVYEGHCGDLKCLAGDSLKGTVSWDSQKGKSYFIRISGVNKSAGNFDIVLQDLDAFPSETVINDKCMTSMALSTDGSTTMGSTDIATFALEGAGSCYRTMNAGRGVWYDIIGTGSSLVASTNSSDAQLAVFAGNCANLECITASDMAEGVAPYVQWQADLGQRYFILAHGVGGGKGYPFEISIGNNAEDSNFVINDFCKGAIGPVASDGSIQRGSTHFATEDRDGAGSCYPDTLIGDGVWYSVDGTGDSLKVHSSLSTGIEPLVTVFEGNCRKLKCVEGTRHEMDDDDRSVLKWRSVEDETYYLLVRGVDKKKGSFEIIVESFVEDTHQGDDSTTAPSPGTVGSTENTPQERPINEICDTASAVPALGYVMSGSTESATAYLDSVGVCHSSVKAAPGVWYSVLGTGGTFQAHITEGSDLDAFIGVYSGDCEELHCVADVEGDNRIKRSYSWKTTQGVTYFLLVQGLFDQTGKFSLVVEESNPASGTGGSSPSTPVNDMCPGALGPLPPNGTIWEGSNEGATFDVDGAGSCYGANATGAGVWFKVIGTGHTLDILSKSLNGFAFSVTLFDGFDCDSLTCVKSDYVAANKAGVLAWNSIHNVPYYVLVHGVGASHGSFELIVLPSKTEGQTEHPLSLELDIISENDRCETAMGPLSLSDTSIAATTGTGTAWEYLEAGACSTFEYVGAWQTTQAVGSWYIIQGSDTVIKASIRAALSHGDEIFISVFEGSCTSLICVDSTAHREGAMSVSWDSSSDLLYYIFVHSPKGLTRSFELKLEQFKRPFNDDCDASLPELVPSNELVRGSTEGATVDADLGNCHDQPSGPGVWYRVVGTGHFMNLIQNNTYNETRISVFSGNNCNDITCLDGFHFDGQHRGPVSWTTVQGENYFVHVQSLTGEAGEQFEFQLEESLRITEAPTMPQTTEAPTMSQTTEAPTMSQTIAATAAPSGSGATCQDAIGPLEGGSQQQGAFDQATVDSVGICGTATNTDPGKWFSVLGTGAGIRISTCNSFVAGTDAVTSSNVTVSVFKQGCDNLQCYIGSNNTCSATGTINWNTEKDELYHVLITGDDVARKEPYVLLHDHTEWLVPNCKGHTTPFLQQLYILTYFAELTGNTKQSGPLVDNQGWLSGCDACNKWGGLTCNVDFEVTRIHLSKSSSRIVRSPCLNYLSSNASPSLNPC